MHWEGGFAYVRERERQKAVIKALHQVHHLHLVNSLPCLVTSTRCIHSPHLTCLVHLLIQVLSRHLAPSNPHLLDSSEDFNARNEAFWFRGGIGPDKSMIKKREGRKKFEEREFRDKVKITR